MDILKFTRSRNPELADYLEEVCRSSLNFEAGHPLQHSAWNHIHLSKLEYLADRHEWIDLEYRIQFVKTVMEFWRNRLKGLPPYKKQGYRIYVYEDIAPTITVVAETPYGFPYAHLEMSARFVPNIRKVLELYVNRPWKERFSNDGSWINEDRLLEIIRKNKGSINKPTARILGTNVAQLRRVITQSGLGNEVNTIRKHFKRSPADFPEDPTFDTVWHIFERKLPPNYL